MENYRLSKTSSLLVIAAILQMVWGLVPSASKFVIDEIPIELYIAMRWTISSLIFAAYVGFRRKWQAITLNKISAVSILGILGYGIASFCTLNGLRIGGVTHFALMGALSPAITSLVAIWILKEKPSRIFFFALPLSILGLMLLIVGKYQISSYEVAAESSLWIISGYVLESFVFVFSKTFRKDMPATQYLTIAQLSAALCSWFMQFTWFHQSSALGLLTPIGWMCALFVSIVACVLCYATLHWLLSHIDGHRLALFDGLHTISATIVGVLLFHETLTTLMLIGGVMILGGLISGNLPRGEIDSE